MAFTKVVGAGIHTLAQLQTHNIHSAGIVTATKFVGEMESGGGSSTFQNVTIAGNLTVNGTTTTLDTDLMGVDKVEVAANNTTVAVAITQTGAGDILNLFDGTTEVLTVLDTGEVGIGTVGPQQMLDVRGNATFGIDQRTGNPGTTVGIATVRGHHVNSSGDFARLYLSNSLSGGGGNIPTASIRGVRVGENYKTELAFYTNDTSTLGGANGDGAERLRIDSSGNVGVNNTNPAAYGKFVVTGTSNVISLNASSGAGSLSFFENGTGRFYLKTLNGSDGLAFVDADGSSERLRITSGGVLCVGATAASGSEFLRVKNELLVMNPSNLGDAFIKIKAGETGGSVLEFQADEGDDNDDYWRIQNAGDGLLGFRTKASGSWAEKLRITDDKVMFSVDAKVDGDNSRDLGASGARWRSLHLGTSARIGATGTTASTAGDDLVIEGGSDRGLSIISGTSSSGNIYFGDSSDADVGRIAYQHNDNALDFSVNAGSTALRIKSDGGILQTKTGGNANYTISRNESVGTTDQPIGVIDFASNTAHTVQARIMGKTLGTSNVGGDLVVETRANGGSLDERFRITGGGRVGVGTALPSNSIEIRTSLSTTGRVDAHGYMCRDNWGTHTGIGNGMFSPATNTLAFATNSVERFRIDSVGRFLIAKGTASTTTSQIQIGDPSTGYTWDVGDVPQVLIAGVNNESPTSGTLNIALRVADENSNTMFQIHNRGGGNTDVGQVYAAGQMGIGPGAGNPSEQLYVSKNYNGHTRAVIQNNWGANATAQLKLVSPTDELQLVKYASGDAHISLSNLANLKFSTGGTERMRIDANGKIIVASGDLHATRVQAKFGIDCQGLDIYDGVGVVANYGMAFYNDPNSNKANGIGFFNDDGQTCGGYIVHQDKGSGNLGDLIFATSETSNTPEEVLRINSTGAVTTPKQPAFKVTGHVGNWTHLNVASWYAFDNGSNGANPRVDANWHWHNKGFNYGGASNSGCFSTTTGRFTAPVAGHYYFWYIYYMQRNGGNSDQSSYIHINPCINAANSGGNASTGIMDDYTIYGRTNYYASQNNLNGVTGSWGGWLSAGDTFEFKTYNSNNTNGYDIYFGHSAWGGWLNG